MGKYNKISLPGAERYSMMRARALYGQLVLPTLFLLLPVPAIWVQQGPIGNIMKKTSLLADIAFFIIFDGLRRFGILVYSRRIGHSILIDFYKVGSELSLPNTRNS